MSHEDTANGWTGAALLANASNSDVESLDDEFMGDTDRAFAVASDRLDESATAANGPHTSDVDDATLADSQRTWGLPADAFATAASKHSAPSFVPSSAISDWDPQPRASDVAVSAFSLSESIATFAAEPMTFPVSHDFMEHEPSDTDAATPDPFAWTPVVASDAASVAHPGLASEAFSVFATDPGSALDEKVRQAEDPDPALFRMPEPLPAVPQREATDEPARPSRFGGRSKKTALPSEHEANVVEVSAGAKTPRKSLFAKVDPELRTDHVNDPRWTTVLRVLASVSLVLGLGLGAYTVFGSKPAAKPAAPTPTSAVAAVPAAPTTVPVTETGDVTFAPPGDFTVK